jgi:C4-dicarboxylate-binding protein DctP
MKTALPILTVVLAAVAAIGVAATSSAPAPIVLKFSHVVADETPKGKAALKFKELAGSRTGGRVVVEVYSNSSRFTDTDEIRALQLGAVQMLAPSLSKFGPLGIKEFEAFDLPFIFDSYADLRKVTDGPVGQELLKKLEPKGILGLAYWDNGFKVMSANKPLRNPADFKGLRVRIQSSKVIDAQMRALGAAPYPLDFSQVYGALKSNIVDGTENPPSNLYTQKMHEVQKHVTISNHGYLGYAVIVNKKFWDGLPSDIRAQLESALKDATRFANDIAKRENDMATQAVRNAGKSQVYTLSDEERRAWKRALLPVHKEMEPYVGAQIINNIHKATGLDPNRL